jgi:hypothetical protein
VNVYRPGLLTGDDQTGICSSDNIIWLFLKTCIEVGVGPDVGYNSLLTPVDFAAAAMVRLSQNLTGAGRTFHLINPEAPSFGETAGTDPGQWLPHPHRGGGSMGDGTDRQQPERSEQSRRGLPVVHAAPDTDSSGPETVR